ncbi:SOUL family heme-binding protein [Methylobacterium sp. J-077]|uniref:SOUL family heme-binding protein n=1 Tax=Methylobacterium sp. J-077 TaxID=2836656 RepID=UPI001FB869E3|nr:heme-binding protein [Methylobacterium sp. J-077]MCJ2121480.1 heme-binding protein [Methylobacterium sp. J-077]
MDKFLYYAVTLIEAVLGVFGIRALYEQPRFSVIECLDRGVEIRAYDERVAIETDALEQGDSEAFGRLFRYITGANRAGDHITMTVPVEVEGRRIAMTAPVERSSTGTMRFFLPRKIAAAGAPEPTETAVRVVLVPVERMAALGFSGSATAEARARHEQILNEVLAATSMRADGPIIFMGYDPPFSIPFLRRNEVAVRLRTD